MLNASFAFLRRAWLALALVLAASLLGMAPALAQIWFPAAKASATVVDTGQVVVTDGGDLVVEGREQDLYLVRLPAPALEFFGRHGSVPLPPLPGPPPSYAKSNFSADLPAALDDCTSTASGRSSSRETQAR